MPNTASVSGPVRRACSSGIPPPVLRQVACHSSKPPKFLIGGHFLFPGHRNQIRTGRNPLNLCADCGQGRFVPNPARRMVSVKVNDSPELTSWTMVGDSLLQLCAMHGPVLHHQRQRNRTRPLKRLKAAVPGQQSHDSLCEPLRDEPPGSSDNFVPVSWSSCSPRSGSARSPFEISQHLEQMPAHSIQPVVLRQSFVAIQRL